MRRPVPPEPQVPLELPSNASRSSGNSIHPPSPASAHLASQRADPHPIAIPSRDRTHSRPTTSTHRVGPHGPRTAHYSTSRMWWRGLLGICLSHVPRTNVWLSVGYLPTGESTAGPVVGQDLGEAAGSAGADTGPPSDSAPKPVQRYATWQARTRAAEQFLRFLLHRSAGVRHRSRADSMSGVDRDR